jgi:ribonuclease HI
MTKTLIIYTDGACRGNPGPGGWGVVLRHGEHEHLLYGGENYTTNNRMELTAVIKALESLKFPCNIELFSDSKYVLQGINDWLPNWKKRNWLTASKKPVQNLELWQRLDELASQQKQINWRWVKGHSGDADNELADELANKGIDEL